MTASAVEAPVEHMMLARRIVELEQTDYLSLPQRLRSEMHRLWIRLETLLHPYGPANVATAAAGDLIRAARAELRAAQEVTA